jgi:hypothetical protein
MTQDRLVGAPGVHQAVGQQRQAIERLLLVDAARQAQGVGRPPPGVEGGRAEGVAEDTPGEGRLGPPFGRRLRPIRRMVAEPGRPPAGPDGPGGQPVRRLGPTRPAASTA